MARKIKILIRTFEIVTRRVFFFIRELEKHTRTRRNDAFLAGMHAPAKSLSHNTLELWSMKRTGVVWKRTTDRSVS